MDPITVIVRRRVRPERVAEFEQWQKKINAECRKFAGHLGLEIIRPDDPKTQDYVIIFRFDTEEHLKAWEASDVRNGLVAEAEQMTAELHVEKVSGLEYWFSVPNRTGALPPPKHKMIVVTTCAIYPLVLFVAPLLRTHLGMLPSPVGTLLTSIVLVLLMTYLAMPLMTRLFSRWLFTHRPKG